jgi:ATP phosphoribosyltransferase
MTVPALTLALPKGRLEEQVQDQFARRGIHFKFKDRQLVAHDQTGLFRIFLVKNADLPTYVHHSIAGLGICGDDVLYESGFSFAHLLSFDFGQTRMCLAANEKLAASINNHQDLAQIIQASGLRIASKFTRFTRDYFHDIGLPVEIIKLNGSVELAPVLGLAPLIVDLVETGSTLRANKLEIVQILATIGVHLVANPAYYKLHFKQINQVVNLLTTGGHL